MKSDFEQKDVFFEQSKQERIERLEREATKKYESILSIIDNNENILELIDNILEIYPNYTPTELYELLCNRFICQDPLNKCLTSGNILIFERSDKIMKNVKSLVYALVYFSYGGSVKDLDEKLNLK